MGFKDKEEKRKYDREYYREHKKRPGGVSKDKGEEKKLLVTLRIPTSVVGRVQRIVNEGIATGHFPWRTNAACYNQLLVYGFEHMAGDEFIDELLPYIQANQQIDTLRNMRQEAQSALSKMRTEISELLGIRANDEAVQCYHAMIESFEEMPPTIWRDWLIREAERAFPKLHREKPKAHTFSEIHVPKNKVDSRTRLRQILKEKAVKKQARRG